MSSGNCLKRLPSLQTVNKELAERSLSDFLEQAWSVIEPNTKYLHNWHVDCLCEYLEAVSLGQILRLVITMPPRYSKSIPVSVMWPCWDWTKNPASRWIFSSYAQDLSNDLSLKRRLILQSDWYQENWGHKVTLAGDQNVKSEFKNDVEGVMLATSVGGSVTGKGADKIVMDDLVKPKEAHSEAVQKTAIDHIRTTLSTRLNDKKTGAMVLIMQRLHEKDPANFLIEQGYTHLNLPGIAEGKTYVSYPLSGKVKVREDEELLWPEREGPIEIEAQKKIMGSYGFAGQYQQRPSPLEGGIFKREHWKYFKAIPSDMDVYIQSWDMNFKDPKVAKGKDTDPVCGGIIGKRGSQKFLLDVFCEKVGFTDTVKSMETFTSKHPYTNASAKLIEAKANGAAIMDHLKKKVIGMIPIEPEGGKLSRAMAIQPTIEAGDFFLPDSSLPGSEWVHDFIEEFAVFPNGNHDDRVDMLSQALTYLEKEQFEIQMDTVELIF